jgi:hypothetical protein
MLPKKSSHGVRLVPGIARFSPKFPLRARSLGLLRIACAVILICAAATLDLRAQDPCTGGLCCADAALNPPPPPPPPPAVSPSSPCPPAFQANPDGTKAALACEWLDTTGGAKSALLALQLLTDPTPPPDLNQQLLLLLREFPPDNRDPGLYLEALQNPKIDFLDLLAKANTITPLEKKKPWSKQKDDKNKLFECTQSMINNIFNAVPVRPDNIQHSGPIILAEINSSFGKKNYHLALRQLLDAYVAFANNVTPNYVRPLEKFRAAFEMDADKLASQVAAPKP